MGGGGGQVITSEQRFVLSLSELLSCSIIKHAKVLDLPPNIETSVCFHTCEAPKLKVIKICAPNRN